MLTLALDLGILGIIAFCGWRGYKNGLIRGVFGVVSLVVSMVLANILATAYSGELKDMLNPFVGGFVDSALVEIMEQDVEYDSSGYEDESLDFITSFFALRRIGLSEAPAARVTELAMDAAADEEDADYVSMPASLLSDLVADKLSSVLANAVVFGLAFVLLAIIFSVVGNLIGFVFSLPGLKLFDIISGAAFGLLKGLLIVFALTVVVRYLGLFAPETYEATSVLKYFANNNPIANMIGI